MIFLGALVGFGLGVLLADLFLGSSQSLPFWGFFGAIIGAIIAWPLQKIVVFSGVGLLVGFMVFATVMSRGGEPQTGLIAGATTLVIAGFMAVMVYDYFVIVLMALVSTYLLINICYLPAEFRYMLEGVLSGRESIIDIIGNFGELYSQLIWPSIVILGIILLFAIYMQKVLQVEKADDESAKKAGYQLAWKTTFLFAIILVLYAFGSQFFEFGRLLYDQAGWQSMPYSLKDLSPGNEVSNFCHGPILNISPLSFPAAAFFSFNFIKWYKSVFSQRILAGNRWLNGWIMAVFLGLAILPIIDMIIVFAILRFENFNLAVRNLLGFYKTFFLGPWQVVLIKWLYIFIMFPLLLILAIPALKNKADQNAKESQPNYCI